MHEIRFTLSPAQYAVLLQLATRAVAVAASNDATLQTIATREQLAALSDTLAAIEASAASSKVVRSQQLEARKVALYRNEVTYIADKACKHGHAPIRNTRSGQCVECLKATTAKHRASKSSRSI